VKYEDVNVRRNPVSEAAAFKLAATLNRIQAKIGGKVFSYDMKKEKPTRAELKKALIGRSGDMRAPVLVVGKCLMAGFDESVYREILKI
jgi:arsenate reductase-like glutaredoxin family protein